MKYLEKIDKYGLKPNFRTFGRTEFKTWFGGVLTLLTLALVGAASFLFGQDFWLKINPKVISNEVVPEKSELIYPTSQNFTVMFRLEDISGNPTEDPDDLILSDFQYTHFKRDSNGQWEQKAYIFQHPVKCSETLAVDNPDLPNMDLSQIGCIDWEDIADQVNKDKPEGEELYKPVLGGSWEEDEIGYFGIYIGNSRLKDNGEYEVTDVEKTKKLLEQSTYISVFYPESLFDAANLDKPINRYWKNYFYLLNSQIARLDRFFLSLVKLQDDRGWIFEDVSNSFSVVRVEVENEIALNALDPKSAVSYTFYGLSVYLRRPQKEIKRSYMKIQELGALLGGFIKAVQIVFGFVASHYGDYKRTLFIYEELHKQISSKPIKAKEGADMLSISNNYLKSPNQLKKKEKLNVGFLKGVLAFCFKNTAEKDKFTSFKEFVQKNIDVQTLFELNQKVTSFEEQFIKHTV